jgi:hypothetical protein
LEQLKISYCVKDSSGTVYAEGSLPATRRDPDRSMKMLSQPWSAAIEATMFTGWIYDRLKPHAAALKVPGGKPTSLVGRCWRVLSGAEISRPVASTRPKGSQAQPTLDRPRQPAPTITL